uniref:Uncharacterized protein n=1 Tax=Pipistrellus kuhlii TaxID=59472 RepID=A0A7J7T0L1_PIPKU|nr:hypothetical protein mPipKuh1_009740 [Pipistrellus kuhlii]
MKAITRDIKGHYIILKGSIHPTKVYDTGNIYVSTIGAPKYIKQTNKKLLEEFKAEIDNNTVIVVDFKTPLTSLDRSSRQKTNKETVTLKETLGQMDLIDIYKTFHPNAAEYTFFSSTHGSFTRIDNMLGHKTSL